MFSPQGKIQGESPFRWLMVKKLRKMWQRVVQSFSEKAKKLLYYHTSLPSVLSFCGHDNRQGNFDRIQNQKTEKIRQSDHWLNKQSVGRLHLAYDWNCPLEIFPPALATDLIMLLAQMFIEGSGVDFETREQWSYHILIKAHMEHNVLKTLHGLICSTVTLMNFTLLFSLYRWEV